MKAKAVGHINLPCEVKADDYHEFYEIQYYMEPVIPGIKVKEIGFSEELCTYIGMVYRGNLKEPRNKDMLKCLKKKIVDPSE